MTRSGNGCVECLKLGCQWCICASAGLRARGLLRLEHWEARDEALSPHEASGDAEIEPGKVGDGAMWMNDG